MQCNNNMFSNIQAQHQIRGPETADCFLSGLFNGSVSNWILWRQMVCWLMNDAQLSIVDGDACHHAPTAQHPIPEDYKIVVRNV
jgi:hypothetical protein